MKKVSYLLLAGVLIQSACSNQKAKNESSDTDQIKATITNPAEVKRSEVIAVNLKESVDFAPGMVMIGATPVEAIDSNNDGQTDQLMVDITLNPSEKQVLDLSAWKTAPNFEKKTQAEISRKTGGEWKGREYIGGSFENVDYLSVPPEHTDHSWFIRYEGPGWENELIAYRAYLDWRNAIDIFGKKVDTLVLQKVGSDGFDSYHENAGWGMDILKAGKSLGIGSIGRLNEEGVVEHFENTDSVTCEITRNGYLSSAIETNYFGWETSSGKCDVKSSLSIASKDRATTHTVEFDQQVDGFCTGIVKHPEGEYFTGENGDWGYIATYGKQTLFNDNLGMAIFYKKNEVKELKSDDEYSYLVVFKPSTKLTYQFLGAWEKEINGVQNKEEYIAYLDEKLELLNAPIQVSL